MFEDQLEAVAKSLGMSPTPETVDRLRKQIRAELRDLHPDRNAGDFSAPEARERFAQLSNALVEIDSDTSATSLVPVSTVAPMVTAIIEALGQAGQLEPREASSTAQRQAIRVEAREEARHRFQLSRIGSGFVAALVTGLWLLPMVTAAFGSDSVSNALQASILAPMFAHPLSEPILFGLALYGWLFFALTWFMEQNDRSRIDWVTTDAARGALMRRAIASARVRGEQDSITKADLRDAVGSRFRPIFALRALGVRDVTASFLDRVVGHHITELVAQGALTPSESASLSPRYLIAESVTSELNLGEE